MGIDIEYEDGVEPLENPKLVCGKDFCTKCGDCLACYEFDGCGPDTKATHLWIIDAKRAAELCKA